MNTKSLYETVTLRANCSHNTFITHLDLTVKSLISSRKPSYVVIGNYKYTKPQSINDDIPIFEDYFSAIVANILYLLSGNIDFKSEFHMESDNAYKSVWSKKARGKKIRDRGYYNV